MDELCKHTRIGVRQKTEGDGVFNAMIVHPPHLTCLDCEARVILTILPPNYVVVEEDLDA